jgi:hypothetical protein
MKEDNDSAKYVLSLDNVRPGVGIRFFHFKRRSILFSQWKSRETITNRKIQNSQELRFVSFFRNFDRENKTHHVYVSHHVYELELGPNLQYAYVGLHHQGTHLQFIASFNNDAGKFSR